ncbi:MAG: hypothetical protein H6839_07535 [Planctomycetes bacterium]|nr:hypothetical protein [Planctomycetota bacterium]
METALRIVGPLALVCALLAASPAHACCPADPDSLDQEADGNLLNLIAGCVERATPEYWQATLEALEQPGMPAPLRSMEAARAHAALGDWSAALKDIEKAAGMELGAQTRLEVADLQCRLALTAWWYGGAEGYSPDACLRIAESASAGLTHQKIYAGIIRWASITQPADPDTYLPDFFDLRYFSNKSESKDNGALAERGLGDAEQVLIGLLKFDPIWENFDTIFTLSMVYVVTGRQNLASYTRLRAWEMHENGQRSRVPGASEIDDIKPMTLFRQQMAGVLVPVRVVNEDYRAVIEQQYKARRAYAQQWLDARGTYARSQLDSGVAADAPGFWSGFKAPDVQFPSMAKPQPELPAQAEAASAPPLETSKPAEEPAEADKSRLSTWIMLGALVGILVIGAIAKSRVDASSPPLPEPEESK